MRMAWLRGAQVQPSGRLGLRQLRDQRRPLGAVLVALEVGPVLDRRGPAVEWRRIGRARARAHVAIAGAQRAVREHAIVVRRGQRRHVTAMCDAHAPLGARVVRLQLRQRERPVEQVRAVDVSVFGWHAELVLLEARAHAGPVTRGAADQLAHVRGRRGPVDGDAPRARRGARIQPRHLLERGPLVVDEVVVRHERRRLHALQHRGRRLLVQLDERAAAQRVEIAHALQHETEQSAVVRRLRHERVACAPVCRIRKPVVRKEHAQHPVQRGQCNCAKQYRTSDRPRVDGCHRSNLLCGVELACSIAGSFSSSLQIRPRMSTS
jgi:hypothetical protein